MIKSKQYFILIVILVLISFTITKSYSQTEDDLREMYILNIADGTTWENENSISKYTIGVFSSDKAIVALKNLVKSRRIKGKPVEIVSYENYKDIKQNHIVYVTKNQNAYLSFVYQELKGKNVLIISDRSKQPQYSVVNLSKDGNQKPFDINTTLAKNQNIKFSTTILRLGGSRQDIRKMQIEISKKLEEERKELIEKDAEIEELKRTIKNLNILLKEQEKRIQAFENK